MVKKITPQINSKENNNKDNLAVRMTRKTFEILTSMGIAVYEGIGNAIKKSNKKKWKTKK